MAKKKAFGIPKSLSDGIGETINTGNNNVGQLRYEIVSLGRIHLDDENPRDLLINKNDIINGLMENDVEYERKKSEMESLETLAFSIQKAGVRNPVELYKDNDRYILISGERRVLGSLLAGKTDVPAKILESKPDELQLRFLQWIENIEREDLTIWERLYNIEQLIGAYTNANENSPIDSEVLSGIIGCSKKQSKRYLDVVLADKSIRTTLKEAGIADLIKLSLIVNTKDKDQRERLIEEAANGASRDALSDAIKAISEEGKKISVAVKSKNGAGRPRTSITFSVPINKVSTVQTIIESVITSNPTYMKHAPNFDRIDWSNANHVKTAFETFIDFVSLIQKDLGRN
jgi:ParB family chromosome partitioning protein